MDPTEIIDKAINAVDDNIYSEQESQDTRTDRLRLDMLSDNWLSKSIRPIITIFTGIIWGVSIVVSYYIDVSDTALYSASAVFMSCVSFYFHSRRQEKIIAKKSNAAIQIKKMEMREEKRKSRHDRRMERKKL